MSDPIMDALTYSVSGKVNRWKMAWLMARATYAHCMMHDCGLWYAVRSAVSQFRDYSRPQDK